MKTKKFKRTIHGFEKDIKESIKNTGEQRAMYRKRVGNHPALVIDLVKDQGGQNAKD